MHLFFTPRCLEYHAAGHPERPDRIRSILAALRADASREHAWHVPQPCEDADLLRVHRPSQLRAVASGAYVDADTPHFPNIDDLARLAAGAAMQAAEMALTGQPAFSMMRPPGHHAERDQVMGFCYYNNIAVAVSHLLETAAVERVAIFDFDCHHGNGTENIFRGDPRVRLASVHQSPCYPGTGLVSVENCFHYPLPPGTGPDRFLRTCDDAMAALAAFDPQLLAVSAGFDAHRHDPITDMELETVTFGEVGRRLGALKRPTFAVLEGGYAEELGECVASFVTGWEE